MIEQKQLPEGLKNVLNKYIKNDLKNVTILKTTNIFNLNNLNKTNLFVNLEKVNNFRHINKFHESVNYFIKMGDIYCSCAETIDQRKTRKWRNHFYLISPFILFIDFIYKRFIPKLPFVSKIYLLITKGHNRVMSETEIIGRLVSCGFKLKEKLEISGLTYYLAEKVREPFYDMNPSYGPIFKMKRVGYNGRIISVYKFRTMSPYSEYVQKDIIDKNELNSSGKINNDFRITFYGKFLRKYWIDELPMIINWLKRDLKFVGVRPLSEDYFDRYPEYLQKLRVNTKPGLVPPYYVDLPVTFDEICDSEKKYLNQYFQKPIRTDIKYFLFAFWNIFFKGKRSG